MKDRKKLHDLVFIMPVLYAILAYGMAKLVQNNGMYPSGMDALCHIYKGDALYDAVCQGDFFPIYDPLWYNGVELLRFWEPLPVYLMAFCRFLGGSSMNGYLVFVGLIFWIGAISWFYGGWKLERPWFGVFLGVLWFFMPNNLVTLFHEGNLPRSLCIALLPFLLCWTYQYLQCRHRGDLPKLSVCFAVVCLCSSDFAGMILIGFTFYFIVDALIRHQWKPQLQIAAALFIGCILAGAWLIPSLFKGANAAVTSGLLDSFFQNLFLSIYPAARFRNGLENAYFGLAGFLLAVFGIFLSKKKSMPGFWAGILILGCSSNILYHFLAKLPFSGILKMLSYFSIASCMVLFSFLIWDTLKRGWVLIFAALLILDALPSLPLFWGNQSGHLPKDRMAYYSDSTLVGKAKELTMQRLALIDESGLGAMSNYLITGYEETVPAMHGCAQNTSAEFANIMQVDRSLEEGNYLYLFDRCLELGNDTVIIDTDIVSSMEKSPVLKMDHAAQRVGYDLVDATDRYRLYHLDAKGNWGTVTRYKAIGIGSLAPAISRQFPVVEETVVTNLNEFTFEELKDYDLIYLAGFSYSDKSAAEELVTKLSESGVRIVIGADGIPEDRGSKNQSFLGVVCNPVSFSQGYPNLQTIDGVLDPHLFPSGYREWNTVYVDGLDDVWGTVEDLDWDLPFYGTVRNKNIVIIGLNLPYYLSLTHDEGVEALLSHAMNLRIDELPEREIVPYEIQYFADKIIIDVDRDNVNTGLAYHDSFVSRQEIYAKNHLTFVKAGKTEILLTYPFLWAGISASVMAVIFILAYALQLRTQRQNSEKEAEK